MGATLYGLIKIDMQIWLPLPEPSDLPTCSEGRQRGVAPWHLSHVNVFPLLCGCMCRISGWVRGLVLVSNLGARVHLCEQERIQFPL
jgi:hypothetical protein